MKKIGKLFLALGMIVVFAGCKASTDAPESKAELTGISITTEPARKVYYIGSSALDLTGMVVTATYNNGTTADVTKDVTISGFDSSAATESQTITVTYGGKTATFTVKIKQGGYTFHDTVITLASGITGSYGTDEATYVLFGDWPQDVVSVDDVTTLGLETSKDKITRGYMEFVQGTDGNYYVKHESNWYKVMPIKWRVVDTAYEDASGSPKGKLLVAENILTANVPYFESTSNRTISGSTVFANNYMHSQIRAYLNGINYNAANSADENKWLNKGFLQTAFTSEAAAKIETTKVDNSEGSTTNFDTQNGTITKATDSACDPTEDKIFLLSEYEVTKYSKSTEAYNSTGTGNSRIRVTTDFAKANNAYQSTTDGCGGYYWLRSPVYNMIDSARFVNIVGNADCNSIVDYTRDGVVPALSISF